MSYQKEREHFLVAFGQEFPNAPIRIAELLLRDATSEQREAESGCCWQRSEAQERRAEKAQAAREKRVRERIESIGGTFVDGSGDPRGFPYLILPPSGRTYDWGGRGLGIPGRGYPASAF